MKKLSTVGVIAGVVLCCTTVAQAQFHLSIAPVTGMNFNILTGSDLKNGGSGFGLIIRGQAVMSFSPSIGLMSGLDFYDNRTGSSTETRNIGQTQNGTPVNADVENALSLAIFSLKI